MHAPIFLTTYKRVDHLKRAISSLQRNKIAAESIIYILSDGPKLGDERDVENVRHYLNTVDGFKDVIIFKRDENRRNENLQVLKRVLSHHGACIAIEEDLEFSPAFLEFINYFLIEYKNDRNVFDIGGFTPINHNTELDYYFTHRFEGWGFGLWDHKFNIINDELPIFERILDDWFTINRLNAMGIDIIKMIKDVSEGRLRATDVLICYHCALRGLVSLLPTKTLVINHGLDGTGEHGDIFNPFNSLVLNSNDFIPPKNLRSSNVDSDMEVANKNFYN